MFHDRVQLLMISPQNHSRIFQLPAKWVTNQSTPKTCDKISHQFSWVVSNPLKDMKLSWDHYSQLNGKKPVPNHQRVHCTCLREGLAESHDFPLPVAHAMMGRAPVIGSVVWNPRSRHVSSHPVRTWHSSIFLFVFSPIYHKVSEISLDWWFIDSLSFLKFL